jgi:hypothetical protein
VLGRLASGGSLSGVPLCVTQDGDGLHERGEARDQGDRARPGSPSAEAAESSRAVRRRLFPAKTLANLVESSGDLN